MNQVSTPLKLLFPALLLIAGFVAFDQTFWWREKADYSFGWLVPLFVAYVVYTRWPQIVRLSNANPATVGCDARWARLPGWTLFGAGFALFLFGGIYRAAAGPSTSGTLALAVGSVLFGAGSLYLIHHQGTHTRATLTWLSLFVFPLCVWLVSAPLLTVVENSLSAYLRSHITVVVFGFYDLLGFPIEQSGNILILPNGQVGVAEACSGIRSLTGCLFAGSFLAATQLERAWQKPLLIISALLLAVVGNLIRSLFLTGWSIAFGPESIEGTVHDATGYAVLGFTVVGLVLLLPVFSAHAKVEPRGSISA